MSRQYNYFLSWKTAFKNTLTFYIVWKNLVLSGKFPEILENFPDHMNLLCHENSFQTHINILSNLKKFHLVLKHFQKKWKTLQAIWIYYLMKICFQTHINMINSLEKSHLVWKTCQKIQKRFQTIGICSYMINCV